MDGHFRLVEGGVEVRFEPAEARLLSDLMLVLARLGDPANDRGAARLDPPAYLDDPEADAEWRRFTGTELSAARRADRSVFELMVEALSGEGDTPGEVVLSVAEAQAVMRVVNDVRLVLGARWGIEEPEDYERLRPEAEMVLSFLGWVVTELAEVLAAALDRR